MAEFSTTCQMCLEYYMLIFLNVIIVLEEKNTESV